MALTDSNNIYPKAPQAAQAGLPASSRAALARLPEIHAETSEAASLLRFLRSAVPASAALTLCGILALFVGAAGMQQEFAWSVLVLIGVAAMLRSYIKSTAQAFERAPLRESAKDLRAILFYAGFAWGAGAFLLLGNNPVPLVGLCFAVLPSVLMLALLRDRAGSLNFILPVTALNAIAILFQPWGAAPLTLAMLLVVQGCIMAGLFLSGRGHAGVPAGLSLR